ncbi:MAG: hypothetical protein QQN62_07760, partial [Nitrosopumilus sp.]
MIFGIKQLSMRKTTKPKVSEMVLKFAGDYIDMGDNSEKKQQNLNTAVSAWNIACLDEKERKGAIKKYIKEYKKLNPTHTKQNFNDIKDNIKLLLKEKEKLYSDVNIQIINAQIQIIDGKNHVTVI